MSEQKCQFKHQRTSASMIGGQGCKFTQPAATIKRCKSTTRVLVFDINLHEGQARVNVFCSNIAKNQLNPIVVAHIAKRHTLSLITTSIDNLRFSKEEPAQLNVINASMSQG